MFTAPLFTGTLFALAAGLMWGLVFVGPLLLPEYPATLQSFGRYLAFGLIALPLGWLDRATLRQLTRADWRENLEKVAGVDACPGALLGAVFCGLASYNTIFPRRGHDLYAKALIEAGATAISVRTAQVGGSTPGLVPLSPTAPGSP